MKLITLGTGHGNFTVSRYKSASLLLAGGRQYLIDCGSPAAASMTRLGYENREVRAIFNTHMHLDHIGGLPDMLYAIVRYPVTGQHTDVYLAEERTAELYAFMHAMHLSEHPEYLAFHAVTPGRIFDDGVLRVTAIPTDHIARVPGTPPITFAFLMEAEGKRVLFSGDLRGDFSDFPGETGADVLVCEATHYKPETAAPVFREKAYKRLIFNHVHDPWHGEEGERKLLSYYAELPYPVEIAHDLEKFDL